MRNYEKEDLEELDEKMRAKTRKRKHGKDRFEDDDELYGSDERRRRKKRNRKTYASSKDSKGTSTERARNSN
jgi:hypothetical protein